MDERKRGITDREAAIAQREERIAARETDAAAWEAELTAREAAVAVREERAIKVDDSRRSGVEDSPEETDRLRYQVRTLASRIVKDEGWCQIPPMPKTQCDSTINLHPKPTLLTLPGELRNRIYRLAVLPKEPVVMDLYCLRKTVEKDYWRIKPGEPMLAFTCKAIRREVLSIYYAEATFQILLRSPFDNQYEVERLRVWTKSLGEHAKDLRQLRFQASHSSPKGGRVSVFVDPRGILSISADLVEDGSVSFSRVVVSTCFKRRVGNRIIHNVSGLEPGQELCTCDLQAMWRTLKGEDGEGLLDLAAQCASGNGAVVKLGTCDTCDLPKVWDNPP